MINKNFEKIELDDLQELIQNAVPEGKTIDYKVKLPSNSDADKKEFLADISSFTNASGGDLIFGISEENGLPISIEGIETENVDAEVLKYENIIRDGIEPRVKVAIRAIKLNEQKTVFIFHMNKSWLGPHRVVFKGHDKFYARNSAGKYPLDVSELRTAFNASQTLIEKINKFKTERIIELVSNNTPIPFSNGAKLILHLIPFESFDPTYIAGQ